ncbi:hypothetical protein V8G54_009434 [Vigna mungo]|uniref:Uncharacterized protein n=1 Tax=Vigna mungo TaxID=3915 RepID=A0AAQ3NWR8_VIGMU
MAAIPKRINPSTLIRVKQYSKRSSTVFGDFGKQQSASFTTAKTRRESRGFLHREGRKAEGSNAIRGEAGLKSIGRVFIVTSQKAIGFVGVDELSLKVAEKTKEDRGRLKKRRVSLAHTPFANTSDRGCRLRALTEAPAEPPVVAASEWKTRQRASRLEGSCVTQKKKGAVSLALGSAGGWLDGEWWPLRWLAMGVRREAARIIFSRATTGGRRKASAPAGDGSSGERSRRRRSELQLPTRRASIAFFEENPRYRLPGDLRQVRGISDGPWGLADGPFLLPATMQRYSYPPMLLQTKTKKAWANTYQMHPPNDTAAPLPLVLPSGRRCRVLTPSLHVTDSRTQFLVFVDRFSRINYGGDSKSLFQNRFFLDRRPVAIPVATLSNKFSRFVRLSNKFHEVRGHLEQISRGSCASQQISRGSWTSPANLTRFVRLSSKFHENRDRGNALRYKITALVSILIAGAIGVCIPFMGKVIPALSPDKNVFFLVKAFTAGVILATGFIHILLDALENLTSPYLKEHPWENFPSLGLC